MRESIVKFGPNQGLLGLLTEPTPDRLVAGSPVAVILNAGITHRMGPFRLHVHLARRLAQEGFRVLRIDISGIGDSQIRPGKLDNTQRATRDVADAFDALQAKLGIDRFVLIGLCSGAYNSHNASVADKRVVGAVFMDGIVFRTLGFYCRKSLRYLRPRYWRNFVKRRWPRCAPPSKSQADARALAESMFFSPDLSRQSTRREIEGLLDRGVRMLFLYTDGYDDISGSGQFKEMYGLKPDDDRLQLEYYHKSEHTYRLTENRNVAISRVAKWFAGGYGAPDESAIST